MIKDPELEKLKKTLIEWVYTNPLSLDVFLHKIPLSPIQRQIIILRFVSHEQFNKRGFKEIETILEKSHDFVQKQYIHALKVIQKEINPYMYLHLPNTM